MIIIIINNTTTAVFDHQQHDHYYTLMILFITLNTLHTPPPGLVLTHTHLATPVHPIAYSVLPTPTTTPKIPLQRLDKPARPAPALKTTAGVGKRGRAGSGGTSKRSKTAAAAGVCVVNTCTCVVFFLSTLYSHVWYV